jgi:hypothetical protein
MGARKVVQKRDTSMVNALFMKVKVFFFKLAYQNRG